MKPMIQTLDDVLCKLIALLNPFHPKKPSDLVGLLSSHLRQKIKFLKNVSRETAIFTTILLLTACGSSDPVQEPLGTFETRKPYESKLITAPICPLADENGDYDMRGLSEDEIIHIMQYGCRTETPDGYRSQYAYKTYDDYQEQSKPKPLPQEFTNEDLPAFDMFMTP